MFLNNLTIVNSIKYFKFVLFIFNFYLYCLKFNNKLCIFIIFYKTQIFHEFILLIIIYL